MKTRTFPAVQLEPEWRAADALAGPDLERIRRSVEVVGRMSDGLIRIGGKSPAAVEADINHAAAEVCTSAVREGEIGFFEMNLCVRTVSADGLQQARAALKPA